MLKRLVLTIALIFAATTIPKTAEASTIPFDCSACGAHNTSFDITYQLLSGASSTYALTVTALYAPAGGVLDFTYINAISMKLDGLSFENGTPSVTSGPDGSWTIVAGGLNSSGCSGSGSGFFCANSNAGPGALAAIGGVDTWVFLLDLPVGTVLGPTQAVHFKGHFTNAAGDKVGSLISADFTATENYGGGPNVPESAPVPEPASLVLLGTGLLFGAARLRKRKT